MFSFEIGEHLTVYRDEWQICFDILTKLHIWSDILFMAMISKGAPSAPGPRAEADPSFASTLAHGLDVLAAFRNSFGSLSNADLAARTGLSRPTVSRLTYTLAQLGYLKRDAKGRFELGLGVLATAYPLLSAIKVRQMARPLMRDFAAYAGGTVSIAMPFGLDFIYVETLRTTDAVPHVPDVGFTGTMATTAVGRALLSLFTGDELETHLARVKAERPEEADYVERRTLPDMELCKERGFAVSLGEWRREIFGVAAPLYRTATGDCLSVNCGIPSFRFSAEQIERECGPRILGLARSIRSLVVNDRQSPT
jgi:DNA-binding IclR family transcriptional regulator